MELIDFSKEYTEESLASAIREMKETGYLDEQMADVIHVNTVLRFLHSTTGTRLREASRREQCFAEQPFVLGMESNKIYPNVDADEWILIQGIIDMYFEEDGELVVLDYKTDRVSSAQELVERYHAQLDYYATALERLTGKKVKEKLIYSFALHKEISL
jgi:ATP-dependent helicase/nuclease subunit A